VAIITPPFAPAVNISGAGIPFPTPVFPAGTATGALTVRTVDYHIGQPVGWTYNVNVQREVAASWALLVGYAGSRGYHLVNTLEGNPVVPVVQADGTLLFPAARRAAIRLGDPLIIGPPAGAPCTTRSRRA
jgi:hypothetical protein